MEDKLQPQVRAIKLYGEGTWLVIEVEDTSIQSSCTMYSHTKGGFGDITIRILAKILFNPYTTN